jgi:hypothetical protein
MEKYLLNALSWFLLYISIPVIVRYIILRKPLENKWAAIGIIAPLFICFIIVTNIIRVESQKKLSQELGIPHRTRPHVVVTPMLAAAMLASYSIMRKGHKKSKSTEPNAHIKKELSELQKTENTDPNKDSKHPTATIKSDSELIDQIIDDEFYETAWSEIETESIKKSLWAKAFSECSGDINKTKAKYINARVNELRQEEKEKIAEEDRQKNIALAEEKQRIEQEERQKIAAYSDQLMLEYGISFDGEHYRYKTYRYANLEDAINYVKTC